ncbi:MAG: hypothetical protein LBD30_05370, partial [Verrucomicrobiales bacterium]|nr:hypothetical protein [Verrucomicrobiales bacterium]
MEKQKNSEPSAQTPAEEQAPSALENPNGDEVGGETDIHPDTLDSGEQVGKIARDQRTGTHSDANGKPSNLTAEEYARATSPEFKAEHGDWETYARIEAVKNAPVAVKISDHDVSSQESRRAYRALTPATTRDGETITFVKSAYGKLIYDKRRELVYKVVTHLKGIMEEAVPAYTEPEREPAKHHNISEFKNYVAKITVGNEPYYVRVHVQVAKPNQHQFHGMFVSDIEIEKAAVADVLTQSKIGGNPATTAFSDKKLTQWLNSVKLEDIKIQLDENNEPAGAFGTAGGTSTEELRITPAAGSEDNAGRLDANGKHPNPDLSRPAGGTPPAPLTAHGEKIKQAVYRVFKGAKNAPEIVVVDDEIGLPAGLVESVQQKKGVHVEGFFNPADGKVYLLANNLQPARAVEVALHEIVGHYGLRGLLGANVTAYNKTMDDVYHSLKDKPMDPRIVEKGGYKTLAELAEGYGFDLGTVKGQRALAEELLSR